MGSLYKCALHFIRFLIPQLQSQEVLQKESGLESFQIGSLKQEHQFQEKMIHLYNCILAKFHNKNIIS